LSADEFAAGLNPPQTPGETSAPAQPDRRPGADKLFKRLDANGDHKVTLDEVPEERRDRFKRLIERGDKDGDHALSEQEFAAATAAGGKPADGKGGKEGRKPMKLFSMMDQKLRRQSDRRRSARGSTSHARALDSPRR